MNLFNLLLFPFLSALVCLLLRRKGRWLPWASLMLSAAYLLLSAGLLIGVDGSSVGIIVQQAGNWIAPFGISLVADRLSAVMLFISAFVGFVTSLYALAPETKVSKAPEFYPLFHFLLGGVGGAFLTGDFFNLYVFFEILLLSSFGLMVQGREPGQLESGIKYTLLSLIGSMFFLTGLGFIYAGLGTLNMADVGRGLQNGDWSITTSIGFALMFFAFAAKAGLFPLYFWLPSSYPRSPLVTTSLFAALLTKVGVYAMMRLFILPGDGLPEFYRELILWVSLLTMFVGVLSAASRMEIRSILSFHIISQIGYITLGLAFMTKLALTGTVFYLIHHIVVKANLFLVAGVVENFTGSSQLKKIGGVMGRSWFLALLFLVPAMSLAGLPPLSGFWAKYFVLRAAVEAGQYWAVGIGLLVGLFTLFSMVKIWMEVFWKDSPEAPAPLILEQAPTFPAPSATPPWIQYAAISIFAAWTILMGVGLPWSYGLASRTAEQLMDRKAYIEAVLIAPASGREQ